MTVMQLSPLVIENYLNFAEFPTSRMPLRSVRTHCGSTLIRFHCKKRLSELFDLANQILCIVV